MLCDYIKTLPQYCIPQHTLSRLMGQIAEIQQPCIKNWLINRFIAHYNVDMSIAKQPDPHTYKTFNDFFTREIRPETRPIAANPQHLLSPADGMISQLGRIEQGKLFQAKGRAFLLNELLADDTEQTKSLANGSFVTIYLAPADYHRVHMPVAGQLMAMTYVPGKLFSVNPTTDRCVPRLFARNERLVCYFTTAQGPVVVVMVGAMIVASMSVAWAGRVVPDKKNQIRHWDYRHENIQLSQGQEMGQFALGSTVIVLTSKELDWNESIACHSRVFMGQNIARNL